jgi:hypothetical protein
MRSNMVCPTQSDVFIYHDETTLAERTNLKGHVFLIVPNSLSVDKDSAQRSLDLCRPPDCESISPLNLMHQEIMKVRSKYDAFHKFHFSRIAGKKWNNKNNAERDALETLIDSLRNRKLARFNEPLHCKLAIIFYLSTTLDLYGGNRTERQYRYYETTLRILLKGSLHYLYDNNNKVKVHKIISDGSPYHRELNYDRIVKPLLADGSMKEYAQVSPNTEIVHLISNHKRYDEDSVEFKHCTMLQLADLVLGSVRYTETSLKLTAIPPTGTLVENKKAIFSYPIKQMLREWRRDEHSRRCNYYKSISVTDASLRNDKWDFKPAKRLFSGRTLAHYV